VRKTTFRVRSDPKRDVEGIANCEGPLWSRFSAPTPTAISSAANLNSAINRSNLLCDDFTPIH
jgi:hypothetical protein